MGGLWSHYITQNAQKLHPFNLILLKIVSHSIIATSTRFKSVTQQSSTTKQLHKPELPYMYQIQIYHLQIIFSTDYPLLSTSLYHAKLKAGCSSTDTISCSLRKFPFLYLFQHLKSGHHSHFHGGLFSMLPKSSFPRHLPRFREMRAEP